MKKILLILLFFSVVPKINAAGFLGTFIDYRHEIRRTLGYDTTSSGVLDDTTANQFVRQAVFQVFPILNPRIEDWKILLSGVVDGQYSLDTLTINVLGVNVRKGDTVVSLTYAPRDVWSQLNIEPLLANVQNRWSKRAGYYDWADSIIYFYPVPDLTDSAFVLVSLRIPNIITTDNMGLVPPEYRIVILRYATYLAARRVGHVLLESFYRDYQEIMVSLKELHQRRFAPQIHPDSGYFRSKY